VVPQWPIPRKTKLIVAVAGAAGLGLALGAVFLMEYMDTSLRWEGGGVQSILELPVLGALPPASRRKTVLSDPSGPVTEGVRAMRANVFLMRPDHPFTTLLLTSPGTLEGKSFVLANLAVVLASAANRVIVVDADMRRPSMHAIFDRPNVAGLADVLSNHEEEDGGESFSVPLQETSFDNLYLLTAGRPPTDPATLLTSPHLPALLEFLEDQADVILIDSPPVLGPPDATVLATICEGAILVVRAGSTKMELIQRAKARLLAHEGVNLLGLTVNRAELDGSYYYTSGREGQEPRRRKGDGDRSWLTLSEAAEHLGISKSMARRWCKSGRLPASKSWFQWRIKEEDLQTAVEAVYVSSGH
jgi:capsular exopolysaccharide synthesis family protein